MARRLAGEAGFDFAGESFLLVFDMSAIAHFEDATDQSIFEIFGQLDAARTGAKPPKLSTLGALLQSGLSRHHPDVTRETAMEMVSDPHVMAMLGAGFESSMPAAEKDAPERPKAKAAPNKKQ